MKKDQNVKRVISGDCGHSRSSSSSSSTSSSFNRAHMTSYLPFTETTHLSCTVFKIQQVIFEKSQIFPNPCLSGALLGPTPLNFTKVFGIRKLQSLCTCSVVCVTISFSILTEYRLVKDTHRAVAYTAHGNYINLHQYLHSWTMTIFLQLEMRGRAQR